MRLDFSRTPLRKKAFSHTPMSFCDNEPKDFLSAIVDLVAIETGDRGAREHWQQAQLRNLLTYAVQRSPFWKKRIGTKKLNNPEISKLPVLTRSDVIGQVAAEGSLLGPSDRIGVVAHSTSGSSGTPVRFFVSEMNTRYAGTRTAAQFFIEGLDLTFNRTRFQSLHKVTNNGFTVVKENTWLGHLGAVFKSGINKTIKTLHPNMKLLIEALQRDQIGYLVIQPRLLDVLFQYIDPAFVKQAGTQLCIPVTEHADATLREQFSALGIPVRGNYSSEEVGVIGTECEKHAGHYHVATSNVIVELSADVPIEVEGVKLRKVLVTHLHSYATPFIRYDIGDIASLADRCICGHDGPVLFNIYGQAKRLLKRANGQVTPFSMKASNILKITECEEYRIMQTDLETIVLEIGGRNALTTDESDAFVELIKKYAGDGFSVEVKAVPRIEWGQDIKRLGFSSRVM
jgi:phenylacetate-coenzyme A ligase PaaK-like adenylate-forming protein